MARLPALRALLVFTAAAASGLSVPSLAQADVPPPACPPPAPGASPGTGGFPPPVAPPTLGPNDRSLPPAPAGAALLPAVEAAADRPSNPENPDPTVNNVVPSSWLLAMHTEIYDAWVAFGAAEAWAYGEYVRTGAPEAWSLYTAAGYLRIYFDEYFFAAYDDRGQPRTFPWGHASRGDFNFGFNWWVKPVYEKIVAAAAAYYARAERESRFDVAGYDRSLRRAFIEYHRFTRCNFGKNGRDAAAKDDDPMYPLEGTAGIVVTAADVLR